MRPPSNVPDNLIAIPYAKALLLFTSKEFTAAILRGRWRRRRQRELERETPGGARADVSERSAAD